MVMKMLKCKQIFLMTSHFGTLYRRKPLEFSEIQSTSPKLTLHKSNYRLSQNIFDGPNLLCVFSLECFAHKSKL